MILVLDTEASGLPEPEAAGLEAQPRLMEFAGVLLNETDLTEIGRLEFKVNPQRPIPEEVVKITGLTDADLSGAPLFSSKFRELSEFFLGVKTMVAHNLPYDKGILVNECRRIGKEFSFPWPPKQICTVELTYHLENHRLKMTELYKIATGRELNQIHRAMADVEALVEIVHWLREKELL